MRKVLGLSVYRSQPFCGFSHSGTMTGWNPPQGQRCALEMIDPFVPSPDRLHKCCQEKKALQFPYALPERHIVKKALLLKRPEVCSEHPQIFRRDCLGTKAPDETFTDFGQCIHFFNPCNKACHYGIH